MRLTLGISDCQILSLDRSYSSVFAVFSLFTKFTRRKRFSSLLIRPALGWFGPFRLGLYLGYGRIPSGRTKDQFRRGRGAWIYAWAPADVQDTKWPTSPGGLLVTQN